MTDDGVIWLKVSKTTQKERYHSSSFEGSGGPGVDKRYKGNSDYMYSDK
jgi:hypothetical protein